MWHRLSKLCKYAADIYTYVNLYMCIYVFVFNLYIYIYKYIQGEVHWCWACRNVKGATPRSSALQLSCYYICMHVNYICIFIYIYKYIYTGRSTLASSMSHMSKLRHQFSQLCKYAAFVGIPLQRKPGKKFSTVSSLHNLLLNSLQSWLLRIFGTPGFLRDVLRSKISFRLRGPLLVQIVKSRLCSNCIPKQKCETKMWNKNVKQKCETKMRRIRGRDCQKSDM